MANVGLEDYAVRSLFRPIHLLPGISLLWLSVGVAYAVDYADFPPTLQAILDERIAQLDTNGGVCIAGRVIKSDGTPIHNESDAQVNIRFSGDQPVRLYDGGWFIQTETLSSSHAGSNKLIIVRDFGYDALDARVTTLAGVMTYLDFTLIKTPADQLAWIDGVVLDENGEPFSGAHLNLSFPFANFGYGPSGYSYPHMDVTTGVDGQFGFSGLSTTAHGLTASAVGYAYHYVTVTPPAGESLYQELRLYPNRRIHLRYIHQANGTRSFTSGDLRTGSINWLNGSGGVDFSQGHVEGYDSDDLRDLDMRQTQDVLNFRNAYANGQNGFYDAGAVDFDSVTSAATGGYSISERDVVVGHVYVVRTYEEAQYVKFIVESAESSFRTVTPSDPPPLVFAGYGLVLDFFNVSLHGVINVDTFFAAPAHTGYWGLPSYWNLTGMAGVLFGLDVDFQYAEADLIAARIPETGLAVLRSANGVNWQVLPSLHDAHSNTITAWDLASLSRFALANTLPFLRGDADSDLDMDLRDYGAMQNCFTGTSRSVTQAGCVLGMLDPDRDIDLGDFWQFAACMSAPDLPVSAGCGL